TAGTAIHVAKDAAVPVRSRTRIVALADGDRVALGVDARALGTGARPAAAVGLARPPVAVRHALALALGASLVGTARTAGRVDADALFAFEARATGALAAAAVVRAAGGATLRRAALWRRRVGRRGIRMVGRRSRRVSRLVGAAGGREERQDDEQPTK